MNRIQINSLNTLSKSATTTVYLGNMISKRLLILGISLTWMISEASFILKEIETNYTIGLSDTPLFTKYEFVAAMDKQLQLDCRFKESSDCKANYISVGIEGNSKDMVENCDGDFSEVSAFRRMTVMVTLRQPYECVVKVINRTREVCGASISRKIVDGIPAAPNEFPYYAALFSVQIQLVNCGGTLSKSKVGFGNILYNFVLQLITTLF